VEIIRSEKRTEHSTSGTFQSPKSVEGLSDAANGCDAFDASRMSIRREEGWSVALIDQHEFTCGCIATCLEMLCREITVITFATAAEFIAAGPGKFSLALYHMHADAAQAGASNAAIAALMHERQPTPVLVISDVDDSGSMARALTAGVRGYVPTINTSIRVTIEIMRLVTAGGVFAPVTASMLQQACGQSPAAADVPTDRFTPRQLTVLEHLKRGSANKVIAHKLSMSEGTVKVHVRNIMKKTRATNRTQAVFRAYNSTLGGDAADGRPEICG